jgi:phosphoserine phosphatase RsbU/P
LTRTGAALGVIEGMEIEERTISLEVGDTLLLYTDGLTEAFSPEDETFGVENLELTVSSALNTSSRELLDLLETTVEKFMGSHPPADDLTMLAIQRVKQA